MTGRKLILVRILIAVATFVFLSSILLDWILIKARESSFRWHPVPIEIILFVISFIMLANGVSYLSEIVKNDKNAIKIFTGILALMVFAFALFPQKQAI
ncbi:MAG: hypothetical protein MUC72_08380, partial [Acidobacteria bacterium]|nr:hypothetical protein [Acidobacteriota bacterium]